MFKDSDSLKIRKYGTGNYISLGPYITEVKYEYSKLYANGSGRNLAGVMISDLVGIFPKIVVKFKPLTKTELETIIPILDNPRQQVQYYDPYKQTMVTMETYTGNYNVTDTNIISGNMRNNAFEVSFIAVRKRA